MTTPNLNQLPPISDFDNAYVLAQQAHEQGFRGSTFADLYLWLKTKLDVLGLSNTAGLPEEFPQDGDILAAADAGQWTILGPGIYHQPGYPSIEVAEGKVVFAQFDGTQFSIQREVEMPMQEGTEILIDNEIPKGKAVLDYLDGLIVGNSNVSFTLRTGSVNPDGSLSPSVNQLSTNLINVTSDKVTIQGFGEISVALDRIIFYNSTSISPETKIVGYKEPSGNTFTVDVPTGAVCYIVNVASGTNIGENPHTSPYNNSLKIFSSEFTSSFINGNKIEGEILTEQIQNIVETKGFVDSKTVINTTPQPLELTQGVLKSDGGTSSNIVRARRTSNGANLNSVVHVQQNKNYYYTGKTGIYSAGVAIQYYDINQNFIGYEIPFVSQEVEYDRKMLSLPIDAAYIACCSYDYDPIIETIEKELIADRVLNSSEEKFIYVDSVGGDDDNTGDAAQPFATITKAIQTVGNSSNATIILSQGDYRETIPTASLNSGKFKIISREGHTVRVLGSNKLEGWTKTVGYNNVYDIPFTGTVPNWSRNANPIFEDGNPSKPILPNEVHPLQKNLEYRLPFTPILAETSIENVDANPGTYIVTDGKLYIHTTNSDNPEENGFSYENAVRASNTVNNASTTDKKVELEIKGIQFYFHTSGVRSIGFEKVKFINCVSMGTHAAGAFAPNTGFNHFINCEAAYCNGDGFNGHFSSFTGYQDLTDNRSNYPTTIYEQCWAHDNFDDGESSHENHNVVMLRSLLEYNGDSGCRPSNDATYYVSDCMFRYNGWEVGVGTNRGEGFAVVNPPLSEHRKGCRAILYNCVSYGNNMGYAAISDGENYAELINCTSRDNTTAEYFVNNGAKVRLRNCRGYNSDVSKLKVTANGVIEVVNEELVV